jgi:acetolactate synthase-1/2/3 large subunit
MVNDVEVIPAIHVLLRYLEGEGVDTIFGIPGGPISALYAAIYDRNKIRHILAKHEQGAAFMADGYARVRGGLGVCCTTTGPGATNALTAMACSYVDSIPVMLITAQVATKAFGKGALQESTPFGVDLVQIFKPVTRLSTMLPTSERMPDLMKRVLRAALSARPGPVHLNLPADLVSQPIPYIHYPWQHYRPHSETIDREAVEEAARLLVEAETPCILAGHGVTLSGGWEELMKLATRLRIPVATTLKAKGVFPENHPLSLGVFGFAGHARADAYLLSGRVDVLLAIGTSLGEFQTQAWHPRLQPTVGLIQVDLDPHEIGKNYPTDVGIVGDARATLQALHDQVDRAFQGVIQGDPLERLRTEIPRYVSGELMQSDSVPLKPQRVIAEMQQILPDETLLFVDNGNCIIWAGHYYEIRKPATYFYGAGFACMGHGFASSIGGKVAAPNRPVVAIGGDGAFAMVGMEIHTAVEHQIPVIWIVLNNGGHGMVYHGDRILLNRRLESSSFRTGLDVYGIAKSLGARAFQVDSAETFRAALQDALGSGEPCVIDTRIDPEEVAFSLRDRVATLRKFFSGSLDEGPRSFRTPWPRSIRPSRL